MTVHEAHLKLLNDIAIFEGNVNLEGSLADDFMKIKVSVSEMKKAATAAYWNYQKEIETLNRVVEAVQESEVNVYQQNNRQNTSNEIFIQNEPNLQIIDLGTHWMNLKDFGGLSLEHQTALFSDRVVQLNRKGFNKLKYILKQYLV